MRKDDYQIPEWMPKPLVYVSGGVFGVLIAIFLLVLLLRTSDTYFSPSPDILKLSSSWAWKAAIFLSLPLASIFVVKIFDGEKIVWHTILASFFIFMYSCTRTFGLAVGYPMAHASLNKSTQLMRYSVTDPYAYASRRSACPNAVEVESSFLIMSEICKVPSEIRSELQEGEILTLAGKGSSKGVFYTSYFAGENAEGPVTRLRGGQQ